MDYIKKFLGEVLYYLTKVLSFILDIIIKIIDFTVTLVRSIAHGFLILIGMGGFLLLFLLMGPLGFYILSNPIVMLVIIFFLVFPMLGTKFVSFLKYIKYILTEFLYDRANHLMYGTSTRGSFSDYGTRYRRAEEARRMREEQQRQRQQEREWEERFRQWQEYQNQYRNFGSYGYGSYNQNTNGGQTYYDPSSEFKQKYRESCNTLGVPYDSDKYQIKLAYHQKAKQYHPDLNKAPNATEMFQKINGAYEFLSDDNIQRYKNMN